jgi:hypothetical protein
LPHLWAMAQVAQAMEAPAPGDREGAIAGAPAVGRLMGVRHGGALLEEA